jgi:large subunit ribosomal protein L25
MRQIPLTVSRREANQIGKGAARKLRAGGAVPAVLYGFSDQAESVAVAVGDLQKVLNQVSGEVAFLALTIEGEPKPRMAMLQELQFDAIGTKFMHVDFLEIKPKQRLTVEVPLELVGEPAGAEEGGILNQAAYSITVHGLVADIPDSIEVDVSALNVNDSISASELALPSGVEAAWEEDFAVASVLRPSLVELPEDEEEAEEGEEGEEGEEAAEGSEAAEESEAAE